MTNSPQIYWVALPVFLCCWTALLARLKGCNAACWLLGGGILGVLVLSSLPRASPYEGRARKRGNGLGLVLSVVSILAACLLRGFP